MPKKKTWEQALQVLDPQQMSFSFHAPLELKKKEEKTK